MRRVFAAVAVLTACEPGGGGPVLSAGEGESSFGVSVGSDDAGSAGATSSTGEPSSGSAGSSVGSTSGASTSGATSGDTVDPSGAASEPPTWDLGEPEPDPLAGPPPWCVAKKVDFLFQIHRGPWMGQHQSALIQSFPGIISGIEKVFFKDFDFHVMVMDADHSHWGSYDCKDDTSCPGDFGCAAINEPLYPCWAKNSDALTACDTTHGAGLLFPAGRGASNKRCAVPEGRRYLKAGDPGLSEAFQCLAQVGYSGPWKATPAQSLMAMLDPENLALNGPNGCNEGFLREDALLFLVQIANGADFSDYNPYYWYQKVMWMKGWDPRMVFSVGVHQGSPEEPLLCHPYTGQSQQFTDYFENKLQIPICQASYAPDFWKALKMALAICDVAAPQ
jgi:hypothetical protein